MQSSPVLALAGCELVKKSDSSFGLCPLPCAMHYSELWHLAAILMRRDLNNELKSSDAFPERVRRERAADQKRSSASMFFFFIVMGLQASV